MAGGSSWPEIEADVAAALDAAAAAGGESIMVERGVGAPTVSSTRRVNSAREIIRRFLEALPEGTFISDVLEVL